MKPSLYLLIPALFLVSCDQQEVATYDDCITQSMQGVSGDVAARAIIEACQNQFPTNAQAVVEASRLVTRNDTVYEINSNTPFTGVSLAYHENGQVEERIIFQNGKRDGLYETYLENGQLAYTVNFKDGEENGIAETYYDDGTLLFRGNYKDGKQNGLSEEYSANGQLWFSADYRDGLIDAPDISDLEEREDGFYEIGSDTPYTGVVTVQNGGLLAAKANLYQGVPDGVVASYNEDGTLQQRTNYKDGEDLGSCYEPGYTDF